MSYAECLEGALKAVAEVKAQKDHSEDVGGDPQGVLERLEDLVVKLMMREGLEYFHGVEEIPQVEDEEEQYADTQQCHVSGGPRGVIRSSDGVSRSLCLAVGAVEQEALDDVYAKAEEEQDREDAYDPS